MGGFPQLLGLGGMVVALWLLDEWLTEPTWRRGLAAGAALFFVGATSSNIALERRGVRSVGRRASNARRRRHRQPGEPHVANPSVRRVADGAAHPVVFAVDPGDASIQDPTTSARSRRCRRSRTRSSSSIGTFRGHGDFALVSAVVAPLLFADRWRDRLWIVATSLLATGISHDRRAPRGSLPLSPAARCRTRPRPVGTGARGAPLPFMRRLRPAPRPRGRVFVVAQIVTGAHGFGVQRGRWTTFSTRAVPRRSNGSRGTRQTTCGLPLLIVRAAPLGWWVEGLGRRQSLLASALRWLNFPDEVRRARQANAVFTENFPNDGTIARARHGRSRLCGSCRSFADR